MSDPDEATLTAVAEQAAEAIRTLNHRTVFGDMPAPLVYDLLGELQAVAGRMPQLLQQCGQGLARSLDRYEVYEDDGGSPLDSIASATDHLGNAAALLEQAGVELDRARNAIRGQGYRDAGTTS